ncbi:MAG: NADH:ubiquinone oxidoreductase, partial [Opitutaceae bacterium]
MSQWVLKGLTTGIKSTVYPRGSETAAGVTPGRPIGGEFGPEAAAALAARCPVGAIEAGGGGVAVNPRRCVHCYRCAAGIERPIEWETGTYEWAAERPGDGPLGGPFRRSVHIIVVDAGDCGACLNEVKQLANPYYNLHRLGFFITPAPRHADVLLVVGPVTDHMRVALRKVYDAMPTPKRVVAVGACALSGGVFAGSFVCGNGAADLLPVDVEVPGHPPPPLAILHGLLV